MNLDWYFYIGLIASILIAVYTIPQLIKTAKTKDTTGLSKVMLIIGLAGSFLFVLDAIGIMTAGNDVGKNLSSGLPILIANFISILSLGSITYLKFRNEYYAKKLLKISEKELCTDWETNKIKIQDIKQKAKEAKLAAKQAKQQQEAAKAAEASTKQEPDKPITSVPYSPVDSKDEIK